MAVLGGSSGPPPPSGAAGRRWSAPDAWGVAKDHSEGAPRRADRPGTRDQVAHASQHARGVVGLDVLLRLPTEYLGHGVAVDPLDCRRFVEEAPRRDARSGTSPDGHSREMFRTLPSHRWSGFGSILTEVGMRSGPIGTPSPANIDSPMRSTAHGMPDGNTSPGHHVYTRTGTTRSFGGGGTIPRPCRTRSCSAWSGRATTRRGRSEAKTRREDEVGATHFTQRLFTQL